MNILYFYGTLSFGTSAGLSQYHTVSIIICVCYSCASSFILFTCNSSSYCCLCLYM